MSLQIHLHGRNLESLHRFIPKEALPSQYGGTQSAFDNSDWKRELLNDRDYFERLEESRGVDLEIDSTDSCAGKISMDGHQVEFIDADTEDSEGSEESGNTFFNCNSTQSDQIFSYVPGREYPE